ncbi:hypothetical protein GGX14DRAFT_695804 [Mycena pura]|uniref:Transmembrane protein n=1 Tax=Mycena pura TaxID=153505 RepID=A0AAD6YEV8_9AGAR|nr:hypothetical protein GGX14DRAFT_695804 [Mycena pura]
MASVVQFPVDDSSPTVSYSPFGDTFSSPNLSAGWNPHWDNPGFSGATIGSAGSGNSTHITSLDGASLQIQWKGTGIQLFGAVTRSSYNVTLDGMLANASADLASNTLVNLQNLVDTHHALSLVVQTIGPDPLVEFDRALISAPPPPSNISSLQIQKYVLNDTDFSFRGHWSFVNDSNLSYHQSTTAGDTALLQFKGTTFLLRGFTSPEAGNYSVTLDNVTTLFSSRSSFSQTNSLLFFSSGLDVEMIHTLLINNTEGASLALPVGGASVFSLADLITNVSSTPSSLPSISSALAVQNGLSSGTIAALVLAGVLVFLCVVCVLLYFVLYRPYRRRQRMQHRRQPKEDQDQDAASVLVVDIGPGALGTKMFYDPADFAGPSRDRTSKRSGFARWKEEVEGGRLGSWGRGALGIAFRHSDSSGRRGTTSASSNEYDMGAISDSYKSTSSSNGGRAARGKGKGRESSWWPKNGRREKSLSPKLKLGLPVESRSRSGSRSNTPSNAPSNGPPDVSVISSLSYLSSPSLNQPTIPSGPPSPSRPSYPNTHTRVGSNGALLLRADVPEPDAGYQFPLPPPPLPDPPPSDPPRQDDRGSVRDFDATDDGRSILGDGTERIALRSLSPRTSEAEQRKAHSKRRAKEKREKERGKTPSPQNPSADAPRTEGSTAHAEQLPELRIASPFQVDFDHRDPRFARLSAQSRVRFESDPGSDEAGKAQGGNDKERSTTKDDENRGKSLKGPFRLTPPGPSNHLRDTSFLDFTSSSEDSTRTRSNDYSSSRSFSSLGPPSHWSIGATSNNMASLVPPQPKSRWSTTTAPSSDVHNNASGDSSDSNFPFPVSLPASPHHPEGTFMPPPAPIFAPSLEPQAGDPRGTLSSLNAHPADLMSDNPTSPTESVPLSVSDIHFQNSDSDEQNGTHRQGNMGLPSHPPLPPIPSQTEEPPYIVQRVVGMHTPSPSIGTTMLGTPTPTATRFKTSPSPSRPSPGSSGRGL